MDIRNNEYESYGEDHPRNVDVAYEKRDLGARGILTFFAVLVIAGVVINFAVWGLYHVLRKEAAAHDPAPHPLAPVERAAQPGILQNTPGVNVTKFPEPRLQPDDASDMDKFRRQEQQLLDAQPWRDENGVVHLPISRALELIAQRGLPSRDMPANMPAPETVQDRIGHPLGTPPSGEPESGNLEMSEQAKPAPGDQNRGTGEHQPAAQR